MKIKLLFEQKPYNHWGSGHRIQYRIRYNRKTTTNFAQHQVHLDNNGFHVLTKIIDYYIHSAKLPQINIYWIKED